MMSKSIVVCLFSCMILKATAHGPPKERDNEDIAMGRKLTIIGSLVTLALISFFLLPLMGPKWCNMAKVCNHDRVPICGLSHAGDIMGFRDLCDMFDYNCIRRRNYKQIPCPDDRSILTVSRRPTNSYYDD